MKLKKTLGSKSFNPITLIESESKQELTELGRNSDIAVSAYFKAESRGYEPGHELQDWLEAEAEMLK
jgi:hypothetical protein